jgi:hypothetical protein
VSARRSRHLDTLRAAHDLAKLLDKQDKRDEAETLFRRALAGRETELGANHASTLESVCFLAELLSKKGIEALNEALSLFRRELAGLHSSLGYAEDTLDAAYSLAIKLRKRNGPKDRLELAQLKRAFPNSIPDFWCANFDECCRLAGYAPSRIPKWSPAARWRGPGLGPYEYS